MNSSLINFLGEQLEVAAQPCDVQVSGKLTRVTGLTLETKGLLLPIGSICNLAQSNERSIEAEVVGFKDNALFLMPTADTFGLLAGAAVTPQKSDDIAPQFGKKILHRRRLEDKLRRLPIGYGLLGRVVDAQGIPLDELGALTSCTNEPIRRRPPNAMHRAPIRTALDVGVRAINGLLCVGQGQRLGLFAGSGVGKSVLLGMMARYTEADVVVVGMIGERGREVNEFIEEILGAEGMKKAVVVVAPADQPAVLRMQAALYCTAIAEHFRDSGLKVLMLMDSLTRYAMAAREVALALGESPATKGYPASVFALLPSLVERAGNGIAGAGSITAFYTVLTEGDDQQDPIADAARAILDGHFVLDRELANSGHFPSIDIEKSVSRVMQNVADSEQLRAARTIRQLWSKVQSSKDLVAVGAYVAGRDAELDRALFLNSRMQDFLQQSMHEKSDINTTRQLLEQLCDKAVESVEASE
jgi:flagellum-specific ATP synthase